MSELILKENTVFGLDIGTRSVVGTVGYKKPTGEFVILAQKTEYHGTRAMLDGQIHDIGKVAEIVCKVKKELEDELNTSLESVCIAAAGRVLKTVEVRMDYDLGDEMVVTEDMVNAMELMGMEQAQAKLRSGEDDDTVFFCVGYSVVRYYLGNVILTNLEGHSGSVISADVIATFLPKDVIDGLYSVCEKAGLKVLNLTLEPIAAINIAIPEKFRLLNLALVDVGAGTSDICITKEGSIIGYGMLPCAGDFLTESLMYEYLTDFNTAEKIKIAASSKKKKIAFKDAMGIRRSVEISEVNELLKTPIEKLTKQIAEKITELNGGERPGAVFVVGGGGKNPDFTAMLSKELGLSEQRVALRGQEVFTQIITPDQKPVKDPMLVTPLGICLNYYDQNHNFIIVNVNGEDVRLYNNGNLNVMDAIMSTGLSESDVFPKRGKELKFRLNGSEKIIRGKVGDSALIKVNGEEGNVSTPIKSGDVLIIEPSTQGENAVCTVENLKELKKEISFIINGKKTSFPRHCLVNGKQVRFAYEIKENDEVELSDYYELGEVIDFLGIARSSEKETEGSPKFSLIINNRNIDLKNCDVKEKIFENYIIDAEIIKEEVKEQKEIVVEKPVEKAPEAVKSSFSGPVMRNLNVTINGVPIVLTGKADYKFVDVLDFYPFNTSTLQGSSIVCRRNGRDADFFTPIVNGDVLELFWK